jgi:hypothetical protein
LGWLESFFFEAPKRKRPQVLFPEFVFVPSISFGWLEGFEFREIRAKGRPALAAAPSFVFIPPIVLDWYVSPDFPLMKTRKIVVDDPGWPKGPTGIYAPFSFGIIIT